MSVRAKLLRREFYPELAALEENPRQPADASIERFRDEDFKCKICGKTFLYEESFRLHLLCSHDEPAIKCPFCSKTFLSESPLRAHTYIVHGIEEP